MGDEDGIARFVGSGLSSGLRRVQRDGCPDWGGDGSGVEVMGMERGAGMGWDAAMQAERQSRWGKGQGE